MYIGLHVKYLLLLSDFDGQILKKELIKFAENMSIGSRVLPCRPRCNKILDGHLPSSPSYFIS